MDKYCRVLYMAAERSAENVSPYVARLVRNAAKTLVRRSIETFEGAMGTSENGLMFAVRVVRVFVATVYDNRTSSRNARFSFYLIAEEQRLLLANPSLDGGVRFVNANRSYITAAGGIIIVRV